VDLLPQGESLRNAVRWISERRREDPKLKLLQLVEEASRRFDLSPVETDFLMRELSSQP
jgi:hypothetical protein